jgi:hypothetical protein
MRFTTNISKKCWITFPPFLANRNSSAAVVFVMAVVGIVASLNHRSPSRIFSGSSLSNYFSSVAMPPVIDSGHARSRTIPLEAATAPSLSAAQLGCGNLGFFPTVAAAQPSQRLAVRQRVANGNEAPESVSSYIDGVSMHPQILLQELSLVNIVKRGTVDS